MSGRIPDQFIDELLARTDITDVVSSRITLKKTGQNYSGLCPFHNEKTPSFSLNPNKQFYYCFGCGAGGNAISFVMEHDHLDFVEAIEALAKDAGLEVPKEKGAPDRYEQNAELLKRLTESAHFFQSQLTQSPSKKKATDYLATERGLSGQIAKVYGIGFAPPGWDNLLKAIGKRAEQQEQLLQGGMLIEKKDQQGHYYDRFRDRIMFPIRDSRGRVIAFGGRAFGDEKPKYLNSPETAVFNKSHELYGLFEAKQNTQNLDHIIVVEGYMDVIVLAQYGITNAVATLGTSVNSQHIRKLFKLVNKITLCFDGDKAGRAAAIRGLEASLPVMQDGKQARFLFLPDGEDPDSLVRQEGQEAFLARLEDANSLANVLFEHARNQVTLDHEEGDAEFARNAMTLIQQIPNDITYRSVLLKQLSNESGIEKEELNQVSISSRKSHYTEPNNHQHHEHTAQENIRDIDLAYHPDNFDDHYPGAEYDNYTTGSTLYLPDSLPNSGFIDNPRKKGGFNKKNNFGKKDFNTPKLPQAPKPLSAIEHAILCLIIHPNVAQDIDIPDPLINNSDESIQTLSTVWRYFYKNPTHNAGHFIFNKKQTAAGNKVISLLNHGDAHTKEKLNSATQEISDLIKALERNLGTDNSTQRLKSKGSDYIKSEDGKQDYRAMVEHLRQQKLKK
ncbi:DNA primase [Marinomonas balearica]|uniref:DNA primase n=1 Tax=Marinomonas balearica TaxID=491947 RepID=A0A4R6M9T6_9GAMM|nr:DNA primase [Marinomonas balearica]TDO98184.1 DNA primase [Marinomonas balearica]